MRVIRNRKRRILNATILALFALLTLAKPYHSGAINAYHQGSSTDNTDGESLPSLPDLVQLSWDDLPAPDAVTVGKPSRIMLRVKNLTSEPMRVELFCTADDGGQGKEKRQFGSISLDPSKGKAIQVDLRIFGFNLAGLKCSGQLEATARAYLADQPQYRQSDSPALYFHPTSVGNASLLTLYGKKALLERFNAGDFRGRLSQRELAEPRTITTRVTFGGAGNPTDRVSDEDAGEPTEPDDDEVTARTVPQTGFPAQPQAATTPGDLPVYNYTTCIRFLIRTVDSSVEIPDGPNVTGTEDHYKGANEGIPVIARGVHVVISLPDSDDPDDEVDWIQQFDADPTTGSFNWSHTATTGFIVRVLGHSTDENNNYVRIHDDPDDVSGIPGNWYSEVLIDVSPTPGGIDTYDVGSYQPEWTAMAALAFGLYRYHGGLSDKAFHVGIDNSRADGASAHFTGSNSDITNGRHYLRLGNKNDDVDDDGDPITPSTKYKFIVTHELGHAIAAIYYGSHDDAVNGGEPGIDFAFDDADQNVCGSGDASYFISSKEWSSVGFREGFAHFIAAKIWNYKDSEGTFTWFAQAHDLERYNFGANNNPGGRLENLCVCINVGCTNSLAGAATNEDWLRFFWDWYTTSPGNCADQPSKTDMLRLYRQVRLNGDLTKSNYFEKMRAAVKDLDGDVSDCLQTTSFDIYSDHNGINN